jgi:hypothetical protein
VSPASPASSDIRCTEEKPRRCTEQNQESREGKNARKEKHGVLLVNLFIFFYSYEAILLNGVTKIAQPHHKNCS